MAQAWYEDVFDFATQTFDKYVDFEVFDLQKDILESQVQNSYTPILNNNGQPPATSDNQLLGGSSNQYITLGLIALGVYCCSR